MSRRGQKKPSRRDTDTSTSNSIDGLRNIMRDDIVLRRSTHEEKLLADPDSNLAKIWATTGNDLFETPEAIENHVLANVTYPNSSSIELMYAFEASKSLLYVVQTIAADFHASYPNQRVENMICYGRDIMKNTVSGRTLGEAYDTRVGTNKPITVYILSRPIFRSLSDWVQFAHDNSDFGHISDHKLVATMHSLSEGSIKSLTEAWIEKNYGDTIHDEVVSNSGHKVSISVVPIRAGEMNNIIFYNKSKLREFARMFGYTLEEIFAIIRTPQYSNVENLSLIYILFGNVGIFEPMVNINELTPRAQNMYLEFYSR